MAGVLKVKVMGDDAHLRKTLKGAAGNVGHFGSVLGKVGIAAGVAAAAGFVKLLGPVGRLQTAMVKANVVFGDTLPIVQNWAAKSANAMGLSAAAAAGLAADFADLLVPLGFTRVAAAGMSTEVVGLSGALSAWTGGTRSATEVAIVLGKAMLGERDGLKELGISISEADVSARVLANGMGDLTGMQLQQAKATATQQLIFEKSKDAQTAFADSTETIYEKQMRLKGVMEEVKAKILIALMPAYEAILSWTLKNMPTIKAVFENVFNAIGKAIDWVSKNVIPVILKAFEAISAGAGFVVRNFEALKPLLVGLLVGFIALKVASAVAAVLAAIAAAGGIAAVATTAFGIAVAFATAPITLIVLAVAALAAGLYYAYTQSETFRNIVQAVWAAVQTAISFAWESVIKPVFGALRDFLAAELPPVFNALKTVAETVFNAIGTAISFAWNKVIKPVFGALKAFFDDVLVPVFNTAKDVAETVFKAIGTVVSFVWNKVIKPGLEDLKSVFEKSTGPVFKALQDVAETVFDAIGAVVKWAWNDIMKPQLALLKAFFDDVLVPVFYAVKDGAETVWKAVSGAVTTAWGVIKPPLEKLYSFVADKLCKVWDTFKDAASTAWGALKGIIGSALGAIGKPISTFLGVVASVAGAIGMDNLADVFRSAATGAGNWGKGMNKGGWVPGTGPDSDSVPAYLTPGEFVLNRKAAARIPERVLRQLNDGRMPLGDMGLNKGGYVKSPDAVLAEARKRVGPYLWGGFGPLFDCSGYMAWLSNFAATGNGRVGGRWATALATGSNTVGRFVPGKGDPKTGFSIGIQPGSHTAGTIAGVNVESSGSRGAHVGGSRGSDYGSLRYNLPDYGGPSASMIGWFKSIASFIGSLKGAMSDSIKNMFPKAGLALAEGVAKHLLEKVPFGKQLGRVAGIYDQGGILPPGVTVVANNTGSNEHVISSKQLSVLIDETRAMRESNDRLEESSRRETDIDTLVAEMRLMRQEFRRETDRRVMFARTGALA